MEFDLPSHFVNHVFNQPSAGLMKYTVDQMTWQLKPNIEYNITESS
jgi:hypothetical protein